MRRSPLTADFAPAERSEDAGHGLALVFTAAEWDAFSDGVAYERSGEGAGIQWINDATTQSWAAVDVDDDGPYPVEQAGPRRLHDEVLAAYRWWVTIGSPPVSAWTVTVGPSGQTIVVDTAPPA